MVRRMFVLALVAGLALGVGSALAVEKPSTDLLVKQGEVTYRVADAFGSPLAQATVTVTGADGEMVAQGVCDQNGQVTLDLPPGDYRMAVGDELTMPLSVREDAAITEVALVTPVNNPYSAGFNPATLMTLEMVSTAVVVVTLPVALIAANEASNAADDADDNKDEIKRLRRLISP